MADLDRELDDIAAVGPLTDVADALDGPNVVQQLVIMGGDFGSDTPECMSGASKIASARAHQRTPEPHIE